MVFDSPLPGLTERLASIADLSRLDLLQEWRNAKLSDSRDERPRNRLRLPHSSAVAARRSLPDN